MAVASAILLVGLALPGAAGADDGIESADELADPYNGSSFGPELMYGFGSSQSGGRHTRSLEVGFRSSYLFLIGDSRLSYVYTFGEDGADSFSRHDLWLQTMLHPLALVLVESEWFAYVIASLYVELGVGGAVYAGDVADRVASPAFQWSIGTGVDVPIGDPDTGWAPWFQALYRVRTDAANFGRIGGLGQTHVVYLGFSVRFNGVLF